MSFKKERLEKIISREVSLIISREIKDERLQFVTITNVNLTNDLLIATLFYTIYGKPEQIEITKKALLEAKGFIKGYLSKILEIRKIPELIFKYDESFAEGNKIEEILRSIKSDK